MGQHSHQHPFPGVKAVQVDSPEQFFAMLDRFFGDAPATPSIPKTLHGHRVMSEDGVVVLDRDDMEIIAEALVFVKNARGALMHDEQVSGEHTSKHHRSLVTMARVAETLRQMEDGDLNVSVTPF
jgi:hypothetical protein